MKEGLFCTFCQLFFSFICFSHWWDWFFSFVFFCFIYISHWPTADRGWHPEAVQDPGRHRAVAHACLRGAVHRVRWPHQWQAAWEVQGKVHQLPQVSAQRSLFYFSRYFVDSRLCINSSQWPCWKKFSSFLYTVFFVWVLILHAAPKGEAGDVWCPPPVWNLRAVIWFWFSYLLTCFST